MIAVEKRDTPKRICDVSSGRGYVIFCLFDSFFICFVFWVFVQAAVTPPIHQWIFGAVVCKSATQHLRNLPPDFCVDLFCV